MQTARIAGVSWLGASVAHELAARRMAAMRSSASAIAADSIGSVAQAHFRAAFQKQEPAQHLC